MEAKDQRVSSEREHLGLQASDELIRKFEALTAPDRMEPTVYAAIAPAGVCPS